MDSDAYERAVRRYEIARENFPRAKRVMDAAQDEYDAAYAALAEFESSPGIPLPQYRRPLAAACSDLHGDDRTRTPHYHAEAPA